MALVVWNGSDIRELLLDAEKIKATQKCKVCVGTGMLNWDEDGNDTKPGGLGGLVEGRMDGECEDCYGIGYTIYKK